MMIDHPRASYRIPPSMNTHSLRVRGVPPNPPTPPSIVIHGGEASRRARELLRFRQPEMKPGYQVRVLRERVKVILPLGQGEQPGADGQISVAVLLGMTGISREQVGGKPQCDEPQTQEQSWFWILLACVWWWVGPGRVFLIFVAVLCGEQGLFDCKGDPQ